MTNQLAGEGFSQHRLEALSASAYHDPRLAGHPLTAVVLAHVCEAAAAYLRGRAVPTAEFEALRGTLQPPLESVIAAIPSGDDRRLESATRALAEVFAHWARSSSATSPS